MRRITAGAPRSPNNVASTFFKTVNLLPKDLSFEHGGAKLASYPGPHLTSLRPCVHDKRRYPCQLMQSQRYTFIYWN